MTTSPVTLYDRLPKRATHERKVLLVLAIAFTVVVLLLISTLIANAPGLTLHQQFERLKVAMVTSVGLELFLIVRLMRHRAIFTVGLFTLTVTGIALYLMGSFS